MRFWWVSRELYEETKADLSRARAELGAERTENRKLWNFLQWRTAGGVAFDTTQLPEAYQPKLAAAAHDDDEKPSTQAPRTPRGARAMLASFEADRQSELDRRSGTPRQLPHVSKEQAEMAARLSKTVDEAQAAGN
jgi:hypothetical protein